MSVRPRSGDVPVQACGCLAPLWRLRRALRGRRKALELANRLEQTLAAAPAGEPVDSEADADALLREAAEDLDLSALAATYGINLKSLSGALDGDSDASDDSELPPAPAPTPEPPMLTTAGCTTTRADGRPLGLAQRHDGVAVEVCALTLQIAPSLHDRWLGRKRVYLRGELAHGRRSLLGVVTYTARGGYETGRPLRPVSRDADGRVCVPWSAEVGRAIGVALSGRRA